MRGKGEKKIRAALIKQGDVIRLRMLQHVCPHPQQQRRKREPHLHFGFWVATAISVCSILDFGSLCFIFDFGLPQLFDLILFWVASDFQFALRVQDQNMHADGTTTDLPDAGTQARRHAGRHG